MLRKVFVGKKFALRHWFPVFLSHPPFRLRSGAPLCNFRKNPVHSDIGNVVFIRFLPVWISYTRRKYDSAFTTSIFHCHYWIYKFVVCIVQKWNNAPPIYRNIYSQSDKYVTNSGVDKNVHTTFGTKGKIVFVQKNKGGHNLCAVWVRLYFAESREIASKMK